MSHVADGELHALLDGALGQERSGEAERIAAHLRSCDDCRARLEEARDLRERAEELLAAAAPARPAMPDFEMILERVGGREPATRPDRRPGAGRRDPLRVLAWAASLLLGVALGWGARSAWQVDGNQGPVAMAERRAAGVAKRDPGLEDLGRADAPVRSEESITSNLGPTSREPGGETAGTPGPTADPERDARNPETPAPQAEVSEPPEPAPDAEIAGLEEVRVTGLERRQVADELTDADELTSADELGRADEHGEVAAPVGEARFRAELQPEGAEFEAPAAAVWIAATPADAARWLGERLLLVDDLPLLDVAVSTAEGERIARARQLLPSGDVVEVRLAPARTAAARSAEGAAAAAGEVGGEPRGADDQAAARKVAPTPHAGGLRGQEVREAVVEAGDLAIRLRAPVAPDSLRALLSRLRPREP